jgi:hypothetical protein
MNDAKELGHRLRNLLKHKKSHQWVCYEFFYANIDRTLLGGENDFRACLKESFPNLKSRNLTREEWRNIKRVIGKPRRCSQAFLAEERALLSNKRQKIRQLQQQKFVDVSYYRDLPEQIPLSLVIGTRVAGLLHHPHFGLFNGVIDAVDTKSHGYRITFDRESIGTHTVPDYEVLSLDQPEFLPLSSFQTRIKPRRPILKSPMFLEILGHQVAEALGGKTNGQTFMSDHDGETGASGQYPIKLLALMVRVSKMLALKKKRIYELKSMNDEVERLHSLDQRVPIELKKSYASTILDLEKLNNDLDDHLKAVQLYSTELSIDPSCIPDPDLIRQKCSNDAKEMLDKSKANYEISNESSLNMISQMMTLMFHLKLLSENDDNSLQMRALNDAMHEFKSKLRPDQMSIFEDNIELHVNYIKNI